MSRLARVALLPLALTAAAKDPLAGRVAGAPQQCIDPRSSTNAVIEEGGRIVWRDGRRWWVATPIGPCPSLRPTNALIIERWGSQLCRNDRFRVLTPGTIIPSAPCRFGNFVPYTAAGK